MKKILYTSLITGVLFAAGNPSAPTPPAEYQTNTKGSCYIKNSIGKSCILQIEASGVGVAPCSACNAAQSMAMARRAAIIDAYKALAEKMYGIKINGRDTVKNMMLQDSRVRAYVYGLIRGANIEEEEYKNGMYTVVMSVKLDPKEWNKYILNSSNTY